MEHQSGNRVPQAIAAVRNAIKDIRILIWAGNYQEARRVIESVFSDYENELREAFELRKRVVKLELEIRKEIPIDDSKPLNEQELKAIQVASEKSSELIKGKADYFSLGVLSNILSKLDKTISKQTSQKTSIPKDFSQRKPQKRNKQKLSSENEKSEPLFGFEYVLIPLGENKSELRAYRFQKSTTNLDTVDFHLKGIPDFHIHKSSSAKNIKGEDTFPHKYVSFSENSHIEITIFDLNRLRIYLATEYSSVDPMEVFQKVLHALK